MAYYHAKKVEYSFDEAIEKTKAALKEEGFGVLTDVDVKATMKQKLDVDFRNYRILGACNPKMAHNALQEEDKIGTMLPCNVIVQELENGNVEIAAIDPPSSMMAVENDKLQDVAKQVSEMLVKVVQNI